MITSIRLRVVIAVVTVWISLDHENTYGQSSCPVVAASGTEPSVAQLGTTFGLAGTNALGNVTGPTYPLIGQGNPVRFVAGRVPCVILKAIGYTESSWRQFDGTGRTVISPDCGYGLMQITSGMKGGAGFDPQRVASEYPYNSGTGALNLINKWNSTPVVGNNDPDLAENWYFAVWAYNGFSYVNNPNNSRYDPRRLPFTGTQSRAQYPYQELVWGWAAHPPNGYWNAVALTLPNSASISNPPQTISTPNPSHGTGCVVPAPSQPAQPSPGSGATGVPVSALLSWSAAAGATSYDVYIGTSPTLSSPISNITSTSFKPTLIPNTIYYWRIVAKNISGSTSSSTWSFITQAPVATPVFSPQPGSYTASVKVNITSTTAGASIVYTTNGADPATSSPTYNGPLTLTSTTTVKAKAMKNGMADSPITTGTYAIIPVGTIQIFATLNGNSSWTGAVGCMLMLNGAAGKSVSSIPVFLPGIAAGTYSMSCSNGPGTLSNISPSPSQQLGDGETKTFTLNFVQPQPPILYGYHWNTSPKNHVNFSGAISGDELVLGTQVFFCVSGSSTCYPQPSQLVVVNSASTITVTNANLTTGYWQVYLKDQYGMSTRSSAFYVSP